jgi:hypothetical protein
MGRVREPLSTCTSNQSQPTFLEKQSFRRALLPEYPLVCCLWMLSLAWFTGAPYLRALRSLGGMSVYGTASPSICNDKRSQPSIWLRREHFFQRNLYPCLNSTCFVIYVNKSPWKDFKQWKEVLNMIPIPDFLVFISSAIKMKVICFAKWGCLGSYLCL